MKCGEMEAHVTLITSLDQNHPGRNQISGFFPNIFSSCLCMISTGSKKVKVMLYCDVVVFTENPEHSTGFCCFLLK